MPAIKNINNVLKFRAEGNIYNSTMLIGIPSRIYTDFYHISLNFQQTKVVQ
jgi:hypothetical protein